MIKKISILVFLLATLGGCSDCSKQNETIELLQKQLDEKQTEINYEYAKHAAGNEHWRQEAVIAAACDYALPICPDSMIENGQEAIKSGSYTGGGWLFWLLVSLKFLVFGSFFGAIWASVLLVKYKLVTPAKSAFESAKETIETAKQQATEATKRAQNQEQIRLKAEAETNRLKNEIANLKKVKNALDDEIEKKKKEIDTLQNALSLLSGL